MADAAEARERLTRVRIEGFKSIAHADVELRDVNVLIGANGAGKSNFIGFLQMIRTLVEQRLPRYVNEQRGADALSHYGSQTTPKIVGRLEIAAPDWPVLYEFDLESVPGDRLVVSQESLLAETMGKGFLPRWSVAYDNPESVLVSLLNRKGQEEITRIAHNVFRLLTGIGVFHFHNSLQNSPTRRFQDLRESQALMSQGENTAVMLLRMRNEFPAPHRRIVEEMRRILPEFRDFVLEPDPFRGKEQIELRWLSQNSDYTMGPGQLSDGSIRAVSLLTLLLQPDEWKPSILVIDEPELGLHPYAVGRIGRLIAEAGTTRQVIVSTQSPGLVAQFEPEDVVVVESERGASTFRRLDRETLGPWLEAYDGDLGRLFEMNVTGGAPE